MNCVRLALVVAATVLLLPVLLLPAAPAAASPSCVSEPPPAKAVFTGTVTATEGRARRHSHQ